MIIAMAMMPKQQQQKKHWSAHKRLRKSFLTSMFTLRAFITSYFPQILSLTVHQAVSTRAKTDFIDKVYIRIGVAQSFFISLCFPFVKFQLHTRASNLFDRVESHDFIRQMCRPNTDDIRRIRRLPERWNGCWCCSNLIKRMIEYSTVKIHATLDANKGETSKRKCLKLNAKIRNTNNVLYANPTITIYGEKRNKSVRGPMRCRDCKLSVKNWR